jgi:hypothetical protein
MSVHHVARRDIVRAGVGQTKKRITINEAVLIAK